MGKARTPCACGESFTDECEPEVGVCFLVQAARRLEDALAAEAAEVPKHAPAPRLDYPEFDIDLCICGKEWPHREEEE